jgi:hypothetical protein
MQLPSDLKIAGNALTPLAITKTVFPDAVHQNPQHVSIMQASIVFNGHAVWSGEKTWVSRT